MMAMHTRKIDTRRKNVLDIIVRYYIDSIEPVSSRIVSDEIGLSSASVRNIMADLEHAGFIHQPYTSAGRVPTKKGYRYYVNFLMEPEDISRKKKETIESIYFLESKSLEYIIEESSHILSYISSLAAIATFPRDEEDRLYYDGAYHMLEQPEFKDLDSAKDLFKALEEKEAFLDIIKEGLGHGETRVRIGRENKHSVLRDCSIITASYTAKGNSIGTVSILGPTRMLYRRLIPIVDYLAKTITGMFDKS